jgi:phenylacetyl-CoA:acceptor oxidoreductase
MPFLRDRTASPYLVAPNGLYLREPQSGKPLVWDETSANAAVPFDTPGILPAVAGSFTVSARPWLSDAPTKDRRRIQRRRKAKTAYEMLSAHIVQYSPEWAETICDVKAETHPPRRQRIPRGRQHRRDHRDRRRRPCPCGRSR